MSTNTVVLASGKRRKLSNKQISQLTNSDDLAKIVEMASVRPLQKDSFSEQPDSNKVTKAVAEDELPLVKTVEKLELLLASARSTGYSSQSQCGGDGIFPLYAYRNIPGSKNASEERL